MKNFYIQTIVLLFITLAGLTSKSNAQFASSNEVYCYQYVKTVEDGVTRNTPNYGKKETVLTNYGVTVPAISRELDYELYFVIFQDNWMGIDHCEDLAKYRLICLSKPDNYSFDRVEKFVNGNRWSTDSENRYNGAASTSSKYTYQNYCWRSGYQGWRWEMYSFSLDKSEMIIWYPSRDIRIYYKRINPNSLKPNLDFLD